MTSLPPSQEHKQILDRLGLARLPLEGVRAFRYQKGETLCSEGMPLEYLFWILAGRAKISTLVNTGKTLLINFTGPGDILGDVELMTGNREATTTVEVVAQMDCLAIPLDANSGMLLGCPGFVRLIGGGLANKLVSSSKNSTVNILLPLEDRLCSYIRMTHEDGIFRENLTHVAELLGVSYRHLMRTLGLLVREGMLERHREGYRVRDFRILGEKAREHYLYETDKGR